MKLSIIVPIYNAEKYLTDCLDSLLCQAIEGGHEVICVNDGSKDNSAEILNEYAEKYPNVIKPFHKENGGVSAARNFGIEKATGEYITFVDADDFLVPNSVGQVVEFLDKEKCSAAITKEYIMTLQNDTFCKDEVCSNLSYKKQNNSSPFVWSLIIKSKLIKENNHRFIENMKLGEDTLFVALSMVYYWDSCLTISGGYYHYRENPSSVTHTISYKQTAQNYYNMAMAYNGALPEILQKDDTPQELKKQLLGRMQTAITTTLFCTLFTKDDYLDEFKKQGMYPYPFQWYILKASKNPKKFALNLFKFLLPIESFYKIAFRLIGSKKN